VFISQPGLALLRRLQEEGPMSLGQLAKVTHMDPAAAGRQVRQLEEDRLVTRTTSPADARVTLVRVTPKGADVRRRVGTVAGRHMEDVLGAWSAADRTKLAQLLARLVHDLRGVAYRSDTKEAAG